MLLLQNQRVFVSKRFKNKFFQYQQSKSKHIFKSRVRPKVLLRGSEWDPLFHMGVRVRKDIQAMLGNNMGPSQQQFGKIWPCWVTTWDLHSSSP